MITDGNIEEMIKACEDRMPPVLPNYVMVQTPIEKVHEVYVELKKLRSKLNFAMNALQSIRDLDYRGNRSTESTIAFNAFEKLK